ncbi:MAG: hypothetical protein KDK48_04805, partial [Chlamydiia bacterium]|nr:hypothetical protein [Chlamydiia bacterium]
MRLLTFFTLTSMHCFAAVTALLQGQLGNQMFEIATAVALARDNGVEATFPGLLTRKDSDIPLIRTQFFFRLQTAPLKGKITDYKEPTHNYSPIPFRDNMMLIGYYQSEKYFKHHEEEIR